MSIPTNPPSNPIPGAVYVDTLTNTAYVYTGSGWVATTGASSYNSQVTTGGTILPGFFATPRPSDFVPRIGNTAPTTPYSGQIWVDTTRTPSLTKIWDGDEWRIVADGQTSNTSVGVVAPSNPDLGDSFYEYVSETFYVWNGYRWRPVGKSEYTHSFTGTGVPILVKRPGGADLVIGDQFLAIDTLSLYTWTGSAWAALVTGTGGSTAGSFLTSAIQPALQPEGSVYYDTVEDSIFLSTGTSWKPLPFVPDTTTKHFTPASATLDTELAGWFTVQVTGNISVVFTNPPAVDTVRTITLRTENQGAHTVTWPASAVWSGGTPPSLTPNGNDIFRFTTVDGGVHWFGEVVIQNAVY